MCRTFPRFFASLFGLAGGVLLPAQMRADGSLPGSIADLGAQVFSAQTHAAALGKDGAGADKIYVLQDGALDGGATPGKLHVVDANSLAVEQSFTLPGSEGGWGMAVASDRKVYAGVYNTGRVFQYTPGDSRVVDLGQALPGQTFLYGMCAGPDGSVFGGTFPGATIFRYTPGPGFSQVGPSPWRPGATYIRTTAYDAANGVIYGGTGAGTQLVRHDLATGVSTDTLPAELAGADFTYGARVVGSKVFVRILDTGRGVVLDVAATGAAKVEASFPMSGLVFTEPEAGCVYYTSARVVHSYNLATRASTAIGSAWTANGYAMAVLTLKDQENFPGKSVVGVSNFDGQIWINKTCLANGHTESKAMAVAETEQTIESIVAGPDGKIYASGYLTGGTGVFSPAEPEAAPRTRRGVEQCEGMTTLGEKIYFGGYPSAYLYEYDPFSPWVAGTNPRVVFNLAAAGQDRPFGMAGDGGTKIFMGTIPGYGLLGGALTEYDVTTGARTVHPHDKLGIPDLSLVSLAYLDGVVYGGTSISGGLGAAPTQTEAKLLKYEVASAAATAVALPSSIPNRKAITAVLAGPDKKIWLMVEGWLVVYNPATGGFDYQANLFPAIAYRPSASSVLARDATLRIGKDGWVYGTNRGSTLFKIDPATMAMTIITSTQGGTGLAADPAGNLYFFSGTKLRRYTF